MANFTSRIYFARVRIRGKLFRQPLKTDMMSVAELRLPDFAAEKQEAIRNSRITDMRTVGECLALFRETQEGRQDIEPGPRLDRRKCGARFSGGFRTCWEAVSEITRVLDRLEQGDAMAAEELLPLAYEELRRIAASKMANEAPGHTLQPTALAHEAWLRLAGDGRAKFENRAHFFGAAAEAMRRILIERARRRIAAKRGGGAVRIDLDEIDIPTPAADDDQLLAVNEALEKFAALDPRKAELVKMRYFVGMNFDEAAAALDIAVPTAKQWWAYARAWLTVELRRNAPR